MPEKKSVTVPLNARQKEQIKKMTGQTINALKVESAGKATLARSSVRLLGSRKVAKTSVTLARRLPAKAAARMAARMAARVQAKSIV